MENVIITGAGRGLGRSLAIELADKSRNLFLIGRGLENLKEVSLEVERSGGYSKLIKYDLTDVANLDELVDEIFKSIDLKKAKNITFINNAGTIKPIKNIGLIESRDLQESLRLNCIAPITLVNSIVRKTSSLNIDLKIINISSGVAQKTIPGWSLYSTGKAAMHSFINTIYLEQMNVKNPIKVVSFDPGVMNTDMQKHIRSVPKDIFREVDKFNNFYEEDLLRNTDEVAKKIKDVYIDNWLTEQVFESIGSYEG